MSDAARWQRVRDLFDSLAEVSAEERAVRLATLRDSQPELAEAVERLLAADASPFPLIDDQGLPRSGDQFGAYTIVRELARGGMATVYVANDARHGRQVVIKVLTRTASSATTEGRFLREVRLAARLQHPNICPVFDSGDRDGLLWYAMPYVAGGTLRDRLDREGACSVAETQRMVREIARGLQHAHDQGIAHRDVKPENVLLASDGSVLVMDFGIARAFTAPDADPASPTVGASLTHTGMVIGTPLYMSPEQLLAEPGVGPAADQYALALIAWEMLAGGHPFVSRTATGEMRMRRGALPSLANKGDVPADLEAVLRRALSDLSEERFPAVREFAEALGMATASEASRPPVTEGSATLASGGGRRPWLTLLVAGAAVAGAVVLWRTVEPGTPTPTVPDSTTREQPTGRVIVLPFSNQGAATDADFAVGVSDAVRSQLVRGSKLEIVPRQTSMSYPIDMPQPESLALQLDVQFIVSGTVQWARDTKRVRVRPSIIEVRRGRATVRWEEAIDAPLADVFAVQDSVARLVMVAANATISSDELASVAAVRTNLDAYEAFLAGEVASQGLSVIDVPSLQKAELAYERATRLDSSYGLAWSHLAVSRAFLMSRVPTPPLAERTRLALDRARRLAPDEPSTAMAVSLDARFLKGDRPGALAAARDGVVRFPRDPLLLAQAAMLELSLGRPDSAMTLISRAERLDPRSTGVLWRKAHIQLWMRDPRAADLTAARALALAPGNLQLLQWRVDAALAEGSLARAHAVARDAIAQGALRPEPILAYIAAAPGLGWALPPELRRATLQLPDSAFTSKADKYLVEADLLWTGGERQAARRAAAAGLAALETSPSAYRVGPMLRAISGDTAGVRSAVAEATERTLKSYDAQFSPNQLLYLVYALGIVGNVDEGRRLLDVMLSRPGPLTREWIAIDPHLATLR